MRWFVAICCHCSFGLCLRAPLFGDGFSGSRSVDVDRRYLQLSCLCAARSRSPDEKLPVMLYLHGSNRRGNDNQYQFSISRRISGLSGPVLVHRRFPAVPRGSLLGRPDA